MDYILLMKFEGTSTVEKELLLKDFLPVARACFPDQSKTWLGERFNCGTELFVSLLQKLHILLKFYILLVCLPRDLVCLCKNLIF